MLAAPRPGGAAPASSAPALAALVLHDDDRILVLAPHPDDEVLGTGGVLREATRRGLPVRVVFLTSGDSNEWSFLAWRGHPVLLPHAAMTMGETREREARAADGALGVPSADLVFLGYPDHATLDIWRSRWGARAPQRGPLTRARAVPYGDALHPGAPYSGESILADLETELRDFRPTHVFVSHPADRHPDHAALYLFTRVALWDLEGELRPQLHPFLVHYPGWPRAHGDTLAPPLALLSLCAWERHPLAGDDLAPRRAALALHRTQFDYSATRLLPLLRINELYGDLAPLQLDAGGQRPTRVAGAGGAPAMTLRLAGDALEIAIPAGHAGADAPAVITLDGWRGDRPFAQMPKLEVRLDTSGWTVRSAVLGSTLARAPARMESGGGAVVRLPLTALGAPTRLLLQARGGGGSGPWWMLALPRPRLRTAATASPPPIGGAPSLPPAQCPSVAVRTCTVRRPSES